MKGRNGNVAGGGFRHVKCAKCGRTVTRRKSMAFGSPESRGDAFPRKCRDTESCAHEAARQKNIRKVKQSLGTE